MPSPFPGMDPYLETSDAWSDFHDTLIQAIRDELSPSLAGRYIAKLDQHVYIREPSASERQFIGRPDAYVAASTARRPAGRPGGPVADAPPVVAEIGANLDVERFPFLELIDKQSRRVVTVIEVLSPSNKADDRMTYLGKRQQVLRGRSNLVEIDLLRGGLRLPISGLPSCDYYAMVARPADQPKVGVWPILLRDRLPTIPVPLAAGDADIHLDLGRAFAGAYDRGGYGAYVHGGSPDPPLSIEDHAWAAGLLSAAGIVV